MPWFDMKNLSGGKLFLNWLMRCYGEWQVWLDNSFEFAMVKLNGHVGLQIDRGSVLSAGV